MLKAIYATKLKQTQTFNDEGKRLVVTKVRILPHRVVQLKTKAKDGYWAIQLGIGEKKNKRVSRSLKQHILGAGYKKTAPLYLKEVHLPEEDLSKYKVGDQIKIEELLKPGDKVMVSGTSKGKGFAGVIKRWGFKGGPRTHGQSDRQRAPGSIGQGTDPGRVWKGKKMPGHMGNVKKTIKSLKVYKLDQEKEEVWLQGLVPGGRGNLLCLKQMS